MHSQQIIIITGYSGSGKSTALDALEDAGFYCIDNMPVALLPKFLDLPLHSVSAIKGFAFVMDLRDRSFIAESETIFQSLRAEHDFSLVFLETDEKTLLNRYKETRRQHPLSQGRSLIDGIRDEISRLKPLRIAADQIIDTSHFNVHQLRSKLLEFADKYRKSEPMHINVMSFGFKYGIPQEADMVIDVRFLDNPYFVPQLKDLDGETDAVHAFVMDQGNAHVFMDKLLDLLGFLLPLYGKEGKSYLTVAVGCTGGRHRSVAIARSLFNTLKPAHTKIALTHRDINP